MDSSDEIWKNECSKFKKLSHIIPAVPRIIAIGDLHGDLNITKKIFKYAKLIDDKYNWIAKPSNTIVIQVGDQLDSCRPTKTNKCGLEGKYIKGRTGDLAIFKFLYYINKVAEKKGGKVISLLGNHELMNVDGDFRFISKNDIVYLTKLDLIDEHEEFRFKTEINSKEALELRKELFKRGNSLAKFMACTRQSAIIIGSNLFVHAGILPEIAKKYKIEDINTIIRKWLLDSINIDTNKRDIGSVKDILYNSQLSPFWVRLFGKIPKDMSIDNEYCDKYIKPVIELWNVNNFIIGHTPTFINGEKLNSTCDNKLWRIDVGLSTAFKKNSKFNNVQFLEIINDNEFNVYEINDNKCIKIS